MRYKQLSDEEKEEWAIEKVTPGAWNDLSIETQCELIKKRIWEQDVYDEWVRGIEEQEASKRPTAYKQYRRYMKKNASA